MNHSDTSSRVETYIRKNPGALFIIFFLLILMTCALLLVEGVTVLAEELATYAYFTLALGVLLQLFTYLLHSNERLLVEQSRSVEGGGRVKRREALGTPVLSIVIPAYNEGGTIAGAIHRLKRDLQSLNLDFEIIVVDDGSSDDTYDLIQKIADENKGQVRPIRLHSNRGKGEAFRKGYESSKGRYILLRDADLDLSEHLIPDYLMRLRQADVVIASKRHPESEIEYGLVRSTLSRSFNLLVNGLFNLGLPDTQCGFKLFRRKVLNEIMSKLVLKRYAFDVELLVNARKKGFKIVTAPIVIRNLRERPLKIREIFRMAIDLLAVFYRLHLTHTYD